MVRSSPADLKAAVENIQAMFAAYLQEEPSHETSNNEPVPSSDNSPKPGDAPQNPVGEGGSSSSSSSSPTTTS